MSECNNHNDQICGGNLYELSRTIIFLMTDLCKSDAFLINNNKF